MAAIVDAARGTLTLRGPAGSIGPARCLLTVEGQARPLAVLQGARRVRAAHDLVVERRLGTLLVRLQARSLDGNWTSLAVRVTNRGRKPVRIGPLDLRLPIRRGLQFGGSPQQLRLLSNPRGMGFYAGTRWLLPRRRSDRYDLGPSRPQGGMPYERWNSSWMVTALWDAPSRRGVVLGAVQPMQDGLAFLTEEDDFLIRFFPDTRLIAPGGTAEAATLEANFTEPPREALDAYAARHRQQLPADLLSFAGWNSFDYYCNTERLSDILENADGIAKDRTLRPHLKWICVDSGWEYRWGEYVPVEHRFPGGIPALVAALRERGLQTGLWTAPLLVERWSTHASRWDPDLFVKNEKGEYLAVFNDNCFLVDPTHPAGERYLTEVYRRLHAEGVRYFKCDFLELGFAHGRYRHQPYLSLTEANRRTLEIIRRAIGPESFLLACISTPEAAIGIADCMRISGDMHNRWSNAQFSALNTAWRWWMHGQLIWNDPDMIMVRGPETARVDQESYRVEQPFQMFRDSGPLFSRREAELWMTFCLLSGGLYSLCDRLSHLNAAGRHILRVASENLSQVAARPVDFYEAGLPSTYLQVDGAVTRLGVFNWYDEPRSFTVDTDGLLALPTGAVLEELWTGERRTWRGPFRVRIPPHGCCYFRTPTPGAAPSSLGNRLRSGR